MNCFRLDLLGFGFWAFYSTEMEEEEEVLSETLASKIIGTLELAVANLDVPVVQQTNKNINGSLTPLCWLFLIRLPCSY